MTSTCYYVFIPLEMHARLICAIKFYLLTYLVLNVVQQRPFESVFVKPLSHYHQTNSCSLVPLPSYSPLSTSAARVKQDFITCTVTVQCCHWMWLVDTIGVVCGGLRGQYFFQNAVSNNNWHMAGWFRQHFCFLPFMYQFLNCLYSQYK